MQLGWENEPKHEDESLKGDRSYFCLTALLLAGECINCFYCDRRHYPSLNGTVLALWTSDQKLSRIFQLPRPDWDYQGTQFHRLGSYEMLSSTSPVCRQSLLDCLIHTYCVIFNLMNIYIYYMKCYMYNIYRKEVPGGISSRQPGSPASITASRKERRNSEA